MIRSKRSEIPYFRFIFNSFKMKIALRNENSALVNDSWAVERREKKKNVTVVRRFNNVDEIHFMVSRMWIVPIFHGAQASERERVNFIRSTFETRKYDSFFIWRKNGYIVVWFCLQWRRTMKRQRIARELHILKWRKFQSYFFLLHPLFPPPSAPPSLNHTILLCIARKFLDLMR